MTLRYALCGIKLNNNCAFRKMPTRSVCKYHVKIALDPANAISADVKTQSITPLHVEIIFIVALPCSWRLFLRASPFQATQVSGCDLAAIPSTRWANRCFTPSRFSPAPVLIPHSGSTKDTHPRCVAI
jgi:hypothetical protein